MRGALASAAVQRIVPLTLGARSGASRIVAFILSRWEMEWSHQRPLRPRMASRSIRPVRVAARWSSWRRGRVTVVAGTRW